MHIDRALRLCCLVSLTAGCSVLLPTEIQRAKSAAETSSIVVGAYYHAPGDRPQEFLEVFVTPSATEAEVYDLWCRLLVPHGVNEDNTIVDYDIEDEAISVPLPACD